MMMGRSHPHARLRPPKTSQVSRRSRADGRVLTGAGAGQVLSSMAKLFPLFEPSDTLARDCLIVLAIGVVYKVLFIALFLARTANASRALPAEGGPAPAVPRSESKADSEVPARAGAQAA